ncbi:MAG TPA: FUSC family protein, partial [Solirubrobacterales bacterium]
EQGEWIRLDLTALARVDGAATAEHGPEAADDDGEVAGVLEAAAAALDAIAVSVAHPRRVRDVDRPLAELRRRAGTIEAGQGRRAALVLVRRIDAAAARHGVDHEDTPGAAADGAVTVLLAQLTPGSSAFRHAARLAVALMVAVVAYRSLPLGRGYWVPLTVLFVLKPDHGTTFARGIGRAAGTILGLAIAWALVTTLSPSDGAVIVMLAVLTFGAYALYPANYALFSVLLTIVIALLAQFGGGSPIGALEDRLLDTALGGAIALTAFALWPTTEAASSAHRLAVLVDHQRAWLGLVLSGLADDGVREDRSALRGIRLKTRQARADAEAAVARAQAEPARRRPDRRRPSAVLAAMDRLSASTLALAAAMYEGERTSVTTLGPFARASDDCLKVVSESLESGDWRALRIPRRETAALADAAASATAEDSLATVIVPEAWLILAALEQLDRDARPALGGSGRRVGTGPVEHRGGPPATR